MKSNSNCCDSLNCLGLPKSFCCQGLMIMLIGLSIGIKLYPELLLFFANNTEFKDTLSYERFAILVIGQQISMIVITGTPKSNKDKEIKEKLKDHLYIVIEKQKAEIKDLTSQVYYLTTRVEILANQLVKQDEKDLIENTPVTFSPVKNSTIKEEVIGNEQASQFKVDDMSRQIPQRTALENGDQQFLTHANANEWQKKFLQKNTNPSYNLDQYFLKNNIGKNNIISHAQVVSAIYELLKDFVK